MTPAGVQSAGSPAGNGRLEQLLDTLGGSLIEVICAPSGLDVAVGEPVIFDPVGEQTSRPDDLLLAVGVDVGSAAALDVIEHARQVGACAVVFKVADIPPDSVVRAATIAALAMLAVPAGVDWGQVFTLLRTARGALSPRDAGASELPHVDDMFGLANAIAATLGGATTIEDLRWNVLAYSTLPQPIDAARQATILGHQVPPAWSRALEVEGVFRRLYASTGAVHVVGGDRPGDAGAGEEPLTDLRPRLAIAVRAGGEPLGSIWVIQGDEPFTPAAEQVLSDAAQIAAMHMLHHRGGADLDRRHRAESVRALLRGGFGSVDGLFPPDLPIAVIAFAPIIDDADDVGRELVAERLAGLLTLHVYAYRRHAHVVVLDHVVYVACAAADVVDKDRVTAAAEEFRRHLEHSGKAMLRVGIGSPVTDPRRLAQSRAEADLVLSVLERRKLAVGHIDDLRSVIALDQVTDRIAADPLLQHGKVAKLAAHDAERGTSHVATLRAYLDCFGDVVAAAASLHVHRNTFRYRLARLAEVADLDLDDPEERVIAHLQLHALTRPDH